ncbi:hypothetical protein ACT41Q_07635 [Acinetobacter baumannii]
MPSKEVSDLTDKFHKNVIRAIQKKLNSLEGSILSRERYQEFENGGD